ncbi:MAG: glycosyltransferase, partial [Brevundimonas sp.]
PVPRATAGVESISLGQTFDGALRQRMAAVLGQVLRPWRLMALARGADAVMARNLEMLLLARIALLGQGRAKPLTYECLDIHRSMLGTGPGSGLLRWLEGGLLRRVDRVVVSSPAFASEYFARRGASPVLMLVENKVYAPDDALPPPVGPPPGPPWRIGWFGMIRCRKSLTILSRLAEALPGRVEVEIRGRPSLAEFEDFAALTAAMPGVAFLGPYDSAALASHYDGVHFVWGLDFFEAGLNSRWLLPNRLYEGGARNRPVIAQAEVETGRWLARRGCGVLLEEVETDLRRFFEGLTVAAYADLIKRCADVPRRDLTADAGGSRALVERLVARG